VQAQDRELGAEVQRGRRDVGVKAEVRAPRLVQAGGAEPGLVHQKSSLQVKSGE
jgi:hypothetical protein